MNNPNLLVGLIVTLALELIIEGLLKKSIPNLLAPYQNLIKELLYTAKIVRKPRFIKWSEKSNRYIELETSYIDNSGVMLSRPVISMLTKTLSLEKSEPITLVGDPGAGKTTVLETITYRLASATLTRQRVLIGVFFLGVLASLLNPIALIIFVLAYSFVLKYILQTIAFLRAIKESTLKILRLPRSSSIPLLPIFVDARSDYTGGKVDTWVSMVAKEQLGRKTLRFDQYDGVAWVIDGINEMPENLFPVFVEGWRGILLDKPSLPILFSSRKDQNPSQRLGIEKSLEILPLDDHTVRVFVSSYNKSGNLIRGEQNQLNFNDFVDNNLLGIRGVARNPYWLQMLLNSGLYTSNKGLLFQKFVEDLLTREIELKPEERKRKSSWKNIVPLELEVYLLSCLAHAMFMEKKVGFMTPEDWKKARLLIKTALDDLPYSVDDVLEQAKAAMLVATEFRQRIEFVHQLVQDFFVATFLDNSIRNLMLNNLSEEPSIHFSSVLGDIIDQKDFAEVFLILAGISDYQMEMINWLVQQIIEKREKSYIYLLRNCIEMINESAEKDVSSSVVDILLGSSHDPDIHIRWNTAVVLGEMKNSHILEPLIVDLLEPDSIARREMVRLVDFSDENSVNEIISSLQNPNSLVRRYAIKLLESVDDDRIVEPLISALNDTDPNVRWQAAYALGRVGDKRALSELERLARTDNSVAYSKVRISNTAQDAIWSINLRQHAA